MKKNYEIPESEEIRVMVETSILSGAGGEVPDIPGEEE